MATTKDTIRRCLANAPKNTGHMFVVCDSFDWEDYPMYVPRDMDVSEAVNSNNKVNMQNIMEIYDMDEDWEYQLNVTRAGQEWLNHEN